MKSIIPMNRIHLLIICLIMPGALLWAQQFNDLEREIPFDPQVRKGVLPNGLTYYIRHNEKPEGKAGFYIYQNVGAVLEEDNQNGLAHFLEHMAFNGTKTFPGNSMLDMLERYGVKFGKDVNAYTAKNETVYNISRVPVGSGQLLDSCLFILRDWCNELTLDTEEIDAERGVINEEWRTRYDAGYRLREQTGPAMYNGSIYGRRDVIGSMDVVQTFKPEVLRKFYHDWYRTDLQAVAIVGDIDVDEVEKKVIELFSAIPAVSDPKERVFVTIPDHDEAKYVLATDKELNSVSVNFYIRKEDPAENTMQALKENYIKGYFNSLMGKRFRELYAKGEVPFLKANVSSMGFERGYSALNISTRAREEKALEAFKTVYTEYVRVLQHGFTQGELERLKTNALVQAENAYKNRDQRTNDSFLKSLKNSYLYGYSLASAEFKYEFAREVIPTITTDDLLAYAHKLLGDKNHVFTVTGPDRDDIDFPELEDLQKVMTEVENLNLEPYRDQVPDNAKLLAELPEGGKIISEKEVEELNAKEWILSNGAKVVYRFADYKKESVSLTARSSGGSSLYGAEDLPSYGAIASMAKTFGIGQFDNISYGKVMTGNTARSEVNFGGRHESVNASASIKDLETMFKLVYMRFEAPRFDREKFDISMERQRDALKNKVDNATSLMRDTLGSILNENNPRHQKFNIELLEAIDFDRMEEIYKERFSGAADFIFFIVGDVKEETLKPLVEKYIGGIKPGIEHEEWRSHEEYFPEGTNSHRIAIPMEQPKGRFMLKVKNDYKYERERVIQHSILASVLNLRFTENIREKEGGTYGVSVRTNATREPFQNLTMDISFECDPDRVDYLKTLVYKELEAVQKEVLESDFEKVLLNIRKSVTDRTENNGFWKRALIAYYDYEDDISSTEYLEDILDDLTNKDIRRSARKFFKNADLLEVIFVPEASQESAKNTTP